MFYQLCLRVITENKLQIV